MIPSMFSNAIELSIYSIQYITAPIQMSIAITLLFVNETMNQI